jgi:3-hydroxyacyl-CoA dehydrogenase
MSGERPVALIGAGSIGVAFALVFVMAGVPVRLQDPDAARRAPADATLASSSSAIVASAFAPDGAGRARRLVVHPGNPPFLLRVAWRDAALTAMAKAKRDPPPFDPADS